MDQNSHSSNRTLIVGGGAVSFAAILGFAAYWFWPGPETENAPREQQSETVDEKVVADFYTSLAALDVGENQLAAKTLKDAVAMEPGEPALWANLAVAQMRLRETEAAGQSLEKAVELAEDSRKLALLRAEVLEQSGEIEEAIEQLRQVHQVWPENLAAAFSLVSLLGQYRTDEAEAERMSLLADILSRSPDNLRALCEKAKIAATLKRPAELQSVLEKLSADQEKWPEPARQQLEAAAEAVQAGDFRKAAVSFTFFENVVKPTPAYQEALAELGRTSAGSIGTPLRSFLVRELPQVKAADPDRQLTFKLELALEGDLQPELVFTFAQPDDAGLQLMSLSEETLRVGESAALSFPGKASAANRSSIAVADLDFDFLQDLVLVGEDGCRIFLGETDGTFRPAEIELAEFQQPWRAVWAVDVEADGDLDLLLSDHKSPLRWIRNNGDLTFSPMSDFLPAEAVFDLHLMDFDGDGDVDLATIDGEGRVSVWNNRRGGDYRPMPAPFAESQRAIATADSDRDGQFELISISPSGEIVSASWEAGGGWSASRLSKWSRSLQDEPVGEVFLAAEDLDNNGGVDLIASVASETGIWLQSPDKAWTSLEETPDIQVQDVADFNGDGLLDLVGRSETRAEIAWNQSQAGYGWYVVKPKANPNPGDKRINSFGIGGRISVRAGDLVQGSSIRSPRTHFGLGHHKKPDVVRIIWPNGSVQAEFTFPQGKTFAAEQRLKGSCPWVFCYDGTRFRFVKDFIWRSPLGLRINAQTTAGVTQTEDWIKIPGDRLARTEDGYRIRITAELWETHFFDHVSLLAVDHPAETEVFVDERFVPNREPALEVVTTTKPKPLPNVVNHQGQSVEKPLQKNDGVYADRFALGEYQGMAEEHWIEWEFPEEVSTKRPVLIVGHGWIYPTDSSLNVAIGQRKGLRPHGLILEQFTPRERWEVLRQNLGFPAGKNKNVLIEIPTDALARSRRFRLRTNMEIYWDALGWSHALPNPGKKTTAMPTTRAELRHRGFSKLRPLDRRRPDTPIYESAGRGQRWWDLEGYYTRFGDVRELLTKTDDRYVIMNAGDELVFEFQAETEVPAGWKRDFILIGNGWVKDGDWNTAFSRWVRPLPSHKQIDYDGPLLPLAEDPVYRQHPDDWQIYHTRYVSPRHFPHQLWRTKTPNSNQENSP